MTTPLTFVCSICLKEECDGHEVPIERARERDGVPWCDACKSYHVVPLNIAQHVALQCMAPLPEMKIPAIEIRYSDEVVCAPVDVITMQHAVDVVPALRTILRGREQESFVMLILDGGGRVTGYREVARGMADQVQIPVREMFRTALLCKARALVLSHNHPSGDPTPSEMDVRLTARLREAGFLLNCPIVDHIIIGGGERFFSFAVGEQETTAKLSMGERQGPELD